MQTINKQTEIVFCSLDIQDIITMIPVMDELAANYHTYKWITERQEGRDTKDSTPIEVYVNKANKVYEQLCILKELGFSTSNNNKEIEPPKEIHI